MDKRIIRVYGNVQGVGFRFFTQQLALSIGNIGGIVRNESDGSVYIEANAPVSNMEQFIEGVRKSPAPSGIVDRIVVEDAPNIETRSKFTVSGYGYY